jgi:antitoxin component of RelBE/YafQ-DinJ toxin-antitoxin module
MSKLTLSVDAQVISRAKRYADRHGISISQIVETYLDEVASQGADTPRKTPILDSLRGSLKSGRREEHRKHLSSKYK